MTDTEKLDKIRKIIQQRADIHAEFNFLEATAFYQYNRALYEKILKEIQEVISVSQKS